MNVEKLTVSDFKESKENYFHFYYERSDSKEGEEVNVFRYETRCKIFGVNVPFTITLRNPTESFETLLPRMIEQLRWLENNKQNILTKMATQRNEDELSKRIFNTDRTRQMSDEKFMNFLVLTELRLFEDYAFGLKFNEFDSLPGNFFYFDISGDRKYQRISVNGV